MRGLSRSIVIQSYVTNQKGIIFSNLIHFCNQRLPLFVNPQHSRARHVLQHNNSQTFYEGASLFMLAKIKFQTFLQSTVGTREVATRGGPL